MRGGGALYKVEADAAPEACARAMPSQPWGENRGSTLGWKWADFGHPCSFWTLHYGV